MWMYKMLSNQVVQGVAEAEDLMTLPPSPAGGIKAEAREMPFLEYFNEHCAQPRNGLNHIINTLALAGHFLYYFSDPQNIANLPLLADPTAAPFSSELANLLAFHPNPAKPDLWSEILLISALLHDLGKTLTNKRDVFNCAQHANKGYYLYHETMHLRPDPKKPKEFHPAPPEREEYLKFLINNRISGTTTIKPTPASPPIVIPVNDMPFVLTAVQALLLFHDRLGVWQTGESGAKSVIEALEELELLAKQFGVHYEQLAFCFFVLTLSDIMASIPDPVFFPNTLTPHPLKTAPAASSTSYSAIQSFLQSWKGMEMIRLLPDLLKPDYASFDANALVKKRFTRMIKNALHLSAAASIFWSLPNADDIIGTEINQSKDVTNRDPALKCLFDKYGTWDYALDRFGDPLYTPMLSSILSKIQASSPPPNTSALATYLSQLVSRFVTLLATMLIGFKRHHIPDCPIINLEFKYHEYPYLYISPTPEEI